MEQPAIAEPLRLDSLLQTALALASVLFFFTGADNYLLTLGGPKPKDVVLLFTAAVAFAFALDLHRPRPSIRSPLMVWLLLYFGLTIAWAPFMRSYEEVWQALYDRCRSIVTLLSFMLIFDDRRTRRTAVLAVAACIVLVSALNVAEFLSLVRFEAGPDRVAGRSAGFYGDPNGAALAITLGLVLVVEDLPASWRMPLFLVSILGVGTTFSRQGQVCLTLVFLWMVWRKAVGPRAVTLGAVAAVMLLAYSIGFATSNDLLNENTASRLRMGGDDSGRIALALKALQMFLASPWVGNGIGATRIWEEDQYAHNMFATLAAEQGILGLLIFPALGVALVRTRRGMLGFALLLMVFGLFNHDLLNSRTTLLLIALMAANPSPALEQPLPALARRVPG